MKKLYDHRPKARIAEYYLPTEIEVKKLAADYAFAADFNLRSRLERVYSSEETGAS